MALMMSNQSFLQQLCEFLKGEVCLPDDRAACPFWQVFDVHGDGNGTGNSRSKKNNMTASLAFDLETSLH
jgi:hypothetical protein